MRRPSPRRRAWNACTDYQRFGHRRYADPLLGGRVHWAGTETSPEVPGHVEGALAAAERAVRAVLSER